MEKVDLGALDAMMRNIDGRTILRGHFRAALHNAYPALAAELRALREQIQMIREYNEALREERDTLRADITASKGLLARIHGDGGHHTDTVGLAQSVADADAKVVAMCAELDALRAEAARLREALVYCRREFESHAGEDYSVMICDEALNSSPTTAEWLAERDAEQRRIGAAEWLEANNERLDTMNHSDVIEEAAKLRKGE